MYEAFKKLLAKLDKLSFEKLFFIKNLLFHCECSYMKFDTKNSFSCFGFFIFYFSCAH